MLEGIQIAEQQVIGFIIKNPESIFHFDVTTFISATARDIYEAMVILVEKNVPLTPQSVAVELSVQFNRAILDSQLKPFWFIDISTNELNFYRQQLERAASMDEAKLKILKPLVENGMSQQDYDIGNFQKAYNNLGTFLQKWEDRRPVVFTGKEAVELYGDTLNERSAIRGFFSSGCSYLDKHATMGFAPGTISTIFGPTGSGKTALALSYFMKQANKSIPALFITLEMTLDAMMDRVFAMRAEIDINQMYPHMNEHGEITTDTFNKFHIFSESFKKMKNIRLVDRPSMNLSELDQVIGDVMRAMGVTYLSVTVDLASMITEFTKDGRSTRADQIEAAMNQMQAIAKRHNCHIMCVVQCGRASEEHRPSDIEDIQKLRPLLKHIKSSNAIAERSRLVIGVFRPKAYATAFFPDDPEAREMTDVMHAIILKQNQGALADLKYVFNGAQSKVTRFIPPEEDQQIRDVTVDFTQPPPVVTETLFSQEEASTIEET